MVNKRYSFTDDLLVVSAHTSTQRVNDTAQPFIQESNFLWLTHIDEPSWMLIFDVNCNKSYLVRPESSNMEKLFDGSADSFELLAASGADEIITPRQGKEILKKLSLQYDTVHSVGPDSRVKDYGFDPNAGPVELWDELGTIFNNRKDIRQDIAKLRAIKSVEELAFMRQAIGISMDGLRTSKKVLNTACFEYELEAELTYAFRKAGAQGHAYEPIVASGKNALTLHYTKNDDKLPKNGLVLIDAGARVNGYCADITRTYAIGTPTKRQIAVHAAVEKAHYAIIALLGPEKSVKQYHEEVDEIMIEALKSLGLYKKPADYRKYFPHAISHGLGVDVHDSLGNPTHFKPGMVLTVEPGIYIPEEEIGVRIEDDILITETGYENLSGALSTSL